MVATVAAGVLRFGSVRRWLLNVLRWRVDDSRRHRINRIGLARSPYGTPLIDRPEFGIVARDPSLESPLASDLCAPRRFMDLTGRTIDGTDDPATLLNIDPIVVNDHGEQHLID